MKPLVVSARRWLGRVVTTFVLGGGLLLLASTNAAAHDCDLRINPEDCQNTAWTIGTTGAVAAVAAVAAAVATSRSGQETEPEWEHAHVRVIAGSTPRTGVEVMEVHGERSPPAPVIQIVPHSDKGIQIIEEEDQ
jgi:hypothetical protein